MRACRAKGQILLATEAFHNLIDVPEKIPERAGLNALDRVALKFRHHDIPVEIVGLNEASATLVDSLSTHNREGAKLASGH